MFHHLMNADCLVRKPKTTSVCMKVTVPSRYLFCWPVMDLMYIHAWHQLGSHVLLSSNTSYIGHNATHVEEMEDIAMSLTPVSNNHTHQYGG